MTSQQILRRAIRRTLLIVTAAVLSSALCACALFEDRKGPPVSVEPREQIYYASFDEVWKAANIVLQPYPLRISNIDQGILETDNIRGPGIWSSPYKGNHSGGAGESYRLKIRIARGSLGNRGAIKVYLHKDIQVEVDFFSGARPKPSDGLEEKTLLYRIGREIQIEHAFVRAQKRTNQGGG